MVNVTLNCQNNQHEHLKFLQIFCYINGSSTLFYFYERMNLILSRKNEHFHTNNCCDKECANLHPHRLSEEGRWSQ